MAPGQCVRDPRHWGLEGPEPEVRAAGLSGLSPDGRPVLPEGHVACVSGKGRVCSGLCTGACVCVSAESPAGYWGLFLVSRSSVS